MFNNFFLDICIKLRYSTFLFLYLQQNDPEKIRTGPDETFYSHMLVFAAEKARKETKVVSMAQDGTFT